MKFWLTAFILIPHLALAMTITCDLSVQGLQKFDTSTNHMMICNGYSWDEVVGLATPSTCPAASKGQQRYNGEMQYCDGTKWRSMAVNCPTTTSACSQAGRQRFTFNGRMIYCDGSYWNIVSSSCESELACEEHIDSASCNAGTGCSWVLNSCTSFIAGCSAHSSMATCNADPNCSWALGTCGDAI